MTVDPDEQPTLNLLDDILGNIYTSTQQSRKDFVRKDYSKPRRRRQAIESTDVSSVALSRSSSARAPLLSGDEDEETKPTSYSARERSSITTRSHRRARRNDGPQQIRGIPGSGHSPRARCCALSRRGGSFGDD